jgi:ankyrin repeat protein
MGNLLEKIANPVDVKISLIEAASRGDLSRVRRLLEVEKVDVNQRDEKLYTALHMAALYCHDDMITYLVEHGADIDVITEEKFTPLHLASREGNEVIVKYLVAKGANISLECAYHLTPLQWAQRCNRINIASFLIKQISEIRENEMSIITSGRGEMINKLNEVETLDSRPPTGTHDASDPDLIND